MQHHLCMLQELWHHKVTPKLALGLPAPAGWQAACRHVVSHHGCTWREKNRMPPGFIARLHAPALSRISTLCVSVSSFINRPLSCRVRFVMCARSYAACMGPTAVYTACCACMCSSMLGEWRSLGNPCTGSTELDRAFTYFAQPTHVLPLPGRPGQYVFMADQWDSHNLAASRCDWCRASSSCPALAGIAAPRLRKAWILSIMNSTCILECMSACAGQPVAVAGVTA